MMKFAALLLAAASPALVAGPALAAVPKAKPTTTVACADGTGSARMWVERNRGGRVTRLAVDNPCSNWMTVISSYKGASPDSEGVIGIAPGAHFNRHVSYVADFYFLLGNGDPGTLCDGSWDSSTVVYRGHHGRFEDGSDAPWCGGIS